MSTGTLAASSASRLALTASYTSDRTCIQAGLAVRFVKEVPPIKLLVVSSIRGPEEALARRPWRPADFSSLLLEEALLLAALLVSDSMRAERMAGERDCHVASTSAGMGISDPMV